MFLLKSFWFTFLIIVLPILILGCEGGAGRGGVEPLSDEPIIVDSVMCLDVDDSRPVLITNSFLENDKKICVWMYWSNIEDRSTVRVVWFEPGSETPYHEETQVIESSTGYYLAWFYITRPSGGFPDGEWSVEIYLNGLFERSHLFIVNPED